MSRRQTKQRTWTDMFFSGLAGCAATLPMTWAMNSMHRKLPKRERYPLPPREIVMQGVQKAGLKEHLNEPQRLGVTLLGHFGMGTAAGTLYGALARRQVFRSTIGGAAYGLVVWGVNYLALLPALGLLRVATTHPPRRTALMIAAHLVWGATLGTLERLRHPSRRGARHLKSSRLKESAK